MIPVQIADNHNAINTENVFSFSIIILFIIFIKITNCKFLQNKET